tara:strand:- start:164 stop:349 length:186 start_codon:yes stop_codon:yes gene_type:complete
MISNNINLLYMDIFNLLLNKEFRNNLILKTFTTEKSFDKKLVCLLVNKIRKNKPMKKLKIN